MVDGLGSELSTPGGTVVLKYMCRPEPYLEPHMYIGRGQAPLQLVKMEEKVQGSAARAGRVGLRESMMTPPYRGGMTPPYRGGAEGGHDPRRTVL